MVTPDPAYIVGNWNVTTNVNTRHPINRTTQSYQVTNTLPSAIYTDAITHLVARVEPNNSSNSIGSRVATRGHRQRRDPDWATCRRPMGNYSGGVENYLRLLENWSGLNLYYNGSMVEMFHSQIGNAPWPGTGTVYNPPSPGLGLRHQFHQNPPSCRH